MSATQYYGTGRRKTSTARVFIKNGGGNVTVNQRPLDQYFGRRTDIIVCGHTHVERIRRYDDVLVINPGSPTYPHNYSAQPGTVGVLTLEENRAGSVEIYDLKTLEVLPELSTTF